VRTAKALLIVLSAASVGFLLLASVDAPGGLAPTNDRKTPRLSAASGSSNDSIASLREKLRGIDRSHADAEQRLAELVARQCNAAAAKAALPTKITELRGRIPRLEAKLAAASKQSEEAANDLAEYSARLQAFLRKHEPHTNQEIEWSDLARKVVRGEPWAKGDPSKWAGTPGDTQDILIRYWRIRDQLTSEKHRKTKATESAVSTRDSVAKSLAAAKSNLEKSERELANSRKDGDETPALVQLARADVTRLAESRGQVTAELAKAEAEKRRHDAQLAAEQQRTKAAKDAESRRLAEAKRREQATGSSVAYTWVPNPRGAFSNLPRAVRTLILAEAAGVDTGLDLLPDDEMSPSGIVRDVLAPVEAPAVGVDIHADGMGVTTRQGNQALVQRANGASSLYTRQGPWESVQYSNGVVGQRYYDDYRGVTQFDFINPNNGVRTRGEQPYEGNDFGQGWSQRVPAW